MWPVPTLVPYALRCENLVNPQGVGRDRPVLSWKLKAAEEGLKGLRQTAYQIRVGSTPTQGDLWDSGRTASSAQYGVTYAGKPLGSGRACWWSVRTWDQKGVASKWSVPARFSTGLLKASDWKAKWIGWDAPDDAPTQPFSGASWIWSAADRGADVGVVKRTFVRKFSLPSKPTKAPLAITADDAMTLWVNDVPVYKSKRTTDEWRTPVRLDLSRSLRAGENEIRVEVENTTSSPAGLIARLEVGSMIIATNRDWTSDGESARIVAPYGQGPWGRFGEATVRRPGVLYRKEFQVRPGLRRATAHVSALGLVDLYLQGRRVSEDLFSPGWTDYHKRVYAKTYDVTALLAPGTAAIGAEVGDGWYAGYVGYSRQRAHYGDRPRVRIQLELEYKDGSKETVATTEGWRAKTGPTRVQDFLIGEEYDARLKEPWSLPAYPDAKWAKAKVDPSIKVTPEPFTGVPVREYQTLRPIKVTPFGQGYMLDYGQNLAGYARLRATGRAGQRVEMKFLEVLNPDGSPYTANLRSARAMDAYTFAGRTEERWSPRFTFHGFRYVLVTGLGHKPKPHEIEAVAISSATPETGTFECSDPMLNRLSKNAWWTQKMNFIDIPTDCPQRDERLGWTGDAQAYIRTASMYSDVQSFFEKWLVTLEDDQRKDGQFPQFAPTIMGGDDGGPAWADAGVICPWTVYDVYGDKRLLAERYPSMKRFVEFCRKRSGEDLLPPKQGYHIFGDWLSINANTPPGVIYEAYFALSTRLLAQSARTLGYKEDAERYEALFRDIRTAFNKAYVTPAGVVAGDTQTAYVLALAFDLLDKPTAVKAAARLVANIESRGWHLSTGFVGTRDLMQALSKIGRNDVAFRLLHNTTFPSWGFEIKNGATTIWERWDGWTPEKGFQDPGMNSFAHYAYGAVMGWVFATIGGIDNAAPGFAKIKIAPKLDPRLTWAKTSFQSVRGPIRTEWTRKGTDVVLKVEIPPNATAEVWVPGETKPRAVGSGSYRFAVAKI